MSHLQNCCLKIYLKRARGVALGGGDQDGCERRIKVFVKIKKKYTCIFFFFFFLGGGGGGQGRCEQRSEVFVKIQFFFIFFCGGGGVRSGGNVRGGGGHRVDVNKELKFL